MTRMHALNLAVCFAACLSLRPAHAATLVRCESTTGVVGYHAAACPPGHRLTRTIAYERVPDAPAVSRRVPAPRTTPRTRTHAAVRARMQHVEIDACNAAKRQRKSAEDRLGLKRTYDDLVALDAPVRAACKGF